MSATRTFAATLLAVTGTMAVASPAAAQFERVTEQYYLPAPHNWQFRQAYPEVDRLFNAFDFGHGILYERLFTEPGAPVERLEVDTYNLLVHRVLPNPPRLPMPEAAFMPNYARLVPLAKEMFDWAHVLHRQAYDVMADRRVGDRDAAIEELVEYYSSRPRLAFTDVPKSMAIMDEQYFSREFRERYPRFNGLIWAYHWLQLAVYEPLVVYDTPEEQRAGVNAVVARFWQMLEDPPASLPTEMPMAPAVAPAFTERYPRVAAIFDNLHMMHDVISDILVSELVGDKRSEIYRAVREFADPAHMALTREAWIEMALAHGVDAQGGPAIGIIRRPEAAPDHEHHHEHRHPQDHRHDPQEEHPDEEHPDREPDPPG